MAEARKRQVVHLVELGVGLGVPGGFSHTLASVP